MVVRSKAYEEIRRIRAYGLRTSTPSPVSLHHSNLPSDVLLSDAIAAFFYMTPVLPDVKVNLDGAAQGSDLAI